MIYKLLADATVLVHMLWIVFLVLGGLWGRKHKITGAFHLSGLAFAVIIQVFDWYCPFTHLEVWLRAREGSDLAYTGSFIIHYIEKIVYMELSRGHVFALTVGLCMFNAWLYISSSRKRSET